MSDSYMTVWTHLSAKAKDDAQRVCNAIRLDWRHVHVSSCMRPVLNGNEQFLLLWWLVSDLGLFIDVHAPRESGLRGRRGGNAHAGWRVPMAAMRLMVNYRRHGSVVVATAPSAAAGCSRSVYTYTHEADIT